MFCHKCGSQISEGAIFCHKCGTKVVHESNAKAEEPQQEQSQSSTWWSDVYSSTQQEASQPQQANTSWWTGLSKGKKTLIICAALLAAVMFLYVYARTLLWIIIGLIVVGLMLLGYFGAPPEERQNMGRSLWSLISGGLTIAVIIGLIVAYNNGAFDKFLKDAVDTVEPGWQVRCSYLTQYSYDVTIEKAFDNYYDSPKWSTYESNGSSYVKFDGFCEYGGVRVNETIVFKILGDQFTVDHLEINGVEQNSFILMLVLTDIYADY